MVTNCIKMSEKLEVRKAREPSETAKMKPEHM